MAGSPNSHAVRSARFLLLSWPLAFTPTPAFVSATHWLFSFPACAVWMRFDFSEPHSLSRRTPKRRKLLCPRSPTAPSRFLAAIPDDRVGCSNRRAFITGTLQHRIGYVSKLPFRLGTSCFLGKPSRIRRLPGHCQLHACSIFCTQRAILCESQEHCWEFHGFHGGSLLR